MPPLLRFILTRTISILISLFAITVLLYGFVMLTPPEDRASVYVPAGLLRAIEDGRVPPERYDEAIQRAIVKYHLNDPLPLQYASWAVNVFSGNWGFSWVLREPVLPAILRRIPVTAELTFYAFLVYMPLGLVSGVLAGSRRLSHTDNNFRIAAFIASTMPPFIVALVLMAIFYVGLKWFAPDRVSLTTNLFLNSDKFHFITGFLTIDGILNRRPDISLEALRHLAMPVFTLSLLQWATIGRVTRASMIEEMQKMYITSARAHGISNRSVIWRHAFRNALSPTLTNTALTAATLFTSVFIIEAIFNLKGISDIVLSSIQGIPDAPSMLGFSLFSVLVVLLAMFALDIVQGIFDPRYREGLLES